MKKILIPVDGSKDSLEGIRLFKELGICGSNEIHILNVQNIMVPYEDYFTSTSKQELYDYLGGKGNEALAEAKKLLAGQEYHEKVAIGDPVTEIMSYAKRNNIDLIVVGSHGKSGLGAVLLGSVTSKLLSYSEVPVLVTRLNMREKNDFKGIHLNRSAD